MSEYVNQDNGGEAIDHDALLMAQLPEEVRDRKPFMTAVLVALSLLMAVIMFLKTGALEPDAQAFVRFGANYPEYTFKGQVWRLFTSSFLHFGIKHLLFNMLCLWSVGCFLEKLIGHWKLFCVYFLTALTGSLVSSMFHFEEVCAGASGAVFGLFGATVSYLALQAVELRLDAKDLVEYMRNGLVFLGINFVYSLFPGVDLAGHMGGLLGGLAVGGVLALPARLKNQPYAEWYRHGIVFATVLIGAIMLISLFVARDADRLDPKELSVEVGNLIREKFTEALKEAGAKDASVEIENCMLFHDGGNDYHGVVSMECECDGEYETLTKKMKVTYDGEQFMYQLED